MTVEVKRRPDGTYEAWEAGTLKPVSTERIHKPIPYGESVQNWASGLTDLELEAAVLIFTDRWTWDVGRDEDRVCLEAIEAELQKRRELSEESPSRPFAVNQIPPSLQIRPPVGALAVDSIKHEVSIYTGRKWQKLSSR